MANGFVDHDHGAAMTSSFARPTLVSRLLTTGAVCLSGLLFELPAQSQFAPLPRLGIPADSDRSWAVLLRDLDGDGDPDLIFNGQQNRLFLNAGDGTFIDATAGRLPRPSDHTNGMAAADVDGDGDVDLVFGNAGFGDIAGQNRLYLNSGNATFVEVTMQQLPADNDTTLAAATADVDGDGDVDLVFGNEGQNRLYLNSGTGTFTDATPQRMPVDSGSATSMQFGDVDGDGFADLVIANSNFSSGGQQNRLYLNDGTGTFTDATPSHMPTASDRTSSVVSGDVDRDGDLDILFSNGSLGAAQTPLWSGQNRLYLNDGTGHFTDATAGRLPPGPGTCMAIGDIDNDGDLDLMSGHGRSCISPSPCTVLNRLYLNDGAGFFTNVTGSHMPSSPRANAVAMGDLDNDADVDIVFAPDWAPNIGPQHRVWFNLRHQLHAETPPQIGQTYTLDAYARHGQPSAVDIALPYVSLAPASISLPPFGTIGIDPSQAIALPPFVIPQPLGRGSASLAVPGTPSLVGTQLYSQALLVPFPIPAERLSNVVHDVVQ